MFRIEGNDTFSNMRISRELDMLREGIRKLIDSIRVEKRLKKKKKDHSSSKASEMGSFDSESFIHSEIKNEIDDLDKFI